MSALNSAVLRLFVVHQYFALVHSFANPRTDFMLMIDESSVAVAEDHTCVLEQKLGDQEIGGRAHCWGYDSHDKTDAPTNVNILPEDISA